MCLCWLIGVSEQTQLYVIELWLSVVGMTKFASKEEKTQSRIFFLLRVDLEFLKAILIKLKLGKSS